MRYINGHGNNQVGGNLTILSSLVHSVNVSPRDIELKAIVNHDWIVGFAYLVSILISWWFLHISMFSSTLKILFSVSVGMLVIFLIEGSQRFMLKYSPWHIKYTDGKITLDGRERKFYEEIWTLSYKKNWIGNGIIHFYGVNPNSHKPYGRKIKFMHNAEAKYVYDSFNDEERITAYKNMVKHQKEMVV